MLDIVSPVAWALTGGPVTAGPDEGLSSLLARSGWTPARLQELRLARRSAEQPWPFPVPADVRGEMGSAQLQAAVQDAIVALGLQPTAPASARTSLTAEEARLAADRPPHW